MAGPPLTGGVTTRHQSTALPMVIPDHHGRYKHIHHPHTQHNDTQHNTHASKQQKQVVREADATSSSTQHTNTTRPIQAGGTQVQHRPARQPVHHVSTGETHSVNNGCKNTDRWAEMLTQTAQAPEQTQRHWSVGCTAHTAWSAACLPSPQALYRHEPRPWPAHTALPPIPGCPPSSRWIRRKLCWRAAHHQRCRHWSHENASSAG